MIPRVQSPPLPATAHTRQSYSGDGGPATAAELSHPSRVAIDCAGDLYINDGDSSRMAVLFCCSIHRFSPAGTHKALPCATDTLTPINSLLAAIDSDVGQTAAWSLAVPRRAWHGNGRMEHHYYRRAADARAACPTARPQVSPGPIASGCGFRIAAFLPTM